MRDKGIDYYMNLDYDIFIEQLPEEDGGGFIAYIPFLGKDMFTASGDTVEEALRILEDVKRDQFEYMLEQGIPIREPDYDDEWHLDPEMAKYLYERIDEE